MNRTITVIFGILAFASIIGLQIWSSNNRYQLVSERNGLAYEVDKKTGESWQLLGNEKVLQTNFEEVRKKTEERVNALQIKLPDEERSKVTGNASIIPPNPDPNRGTSFDGLGNDFNSYHDSGIFRETFITGHLGK